MRSPVETLRFDHVKPSIVGRERSPGEFVLELLSRFEQEELVYAYLRHYAGLPEDVGNDVDLLIAAEQRLQALELIKEVATECGWSFVRAVEFSPLSVFLVSSDALQFLHIDLFDRLEWHWIEYADAAGVLERRRHNGTLFHPAQGDEIYLNVCTRLIYHGYVREKHRRQLSDAVEAGGGGEIRRAFQGHLREDFGGWLADAVLRQDWETVESSSARLRRHVLERYALRCPGRGIQGLARCCGRSARRLLHPPGPFVVFEGADGVGKSTVIRGAAPALEGISGRTDLLLFHWKPSRRSLRSAADFGMPQDPRGNTTRGKIASLLFLMYHWLGFWWGWFRWVYPALVRNRPVVVDRYAYEFLLDPKRLRLDSPPWILRVAARAVPQPKVVIAMIADPGRVVARKQELTRAEVADYQNALQQLATNHPAFVLLNSDGDADMVVAAASGAILRAIAEAK